MIEDFAIQSITLIAFLAFATKRLMNYLHALQQEDYDNTRLSTWIVRNKVYDSRVCQFLIVMSGIALFTTIHATILNIFIFLAFIIAAYFEKDPRKQSKKALAITKRARRILIMALFYTLICAGGAFYISFPAMWIIVIQLIPVMLLLGNTSLAPYEAAVQKKFYNEAKAKLEEVSPTIIAITGSYGKTSVKHILGHILKNSAPTLTTPGSVNTLMGVTRIIREQLQPHHKYFITEMGAYGPGSIAELCAFTPPDIGIITSIGHAHYERFKSLNTVVQAKYELAESVISRNGTMIVHEKTLKFEHSRNIRHRAMDNFIACGEPSKTKAPKTEQEFSYLAPDDLKILSVQQTPKGLCIKIEWKDEKHTLRAPLYGIHHGHNIALAFACAMTLGMEAKDIRAAISTTTQVRHRLEVKQQNDGTIIIDDAFNSNPPGFRSALHVLGVLAEDQGGRAILVTPGIVELGAAHDEVHTTLGTLAAGTCDIVIVVNPQRIPTFINAFQTNSHGKVLMEVDSFNEAQEWIFANKKSNDVILLENDLPDIYEQILKI
ncbi:MAG: Mur ligase [Zetaproteobacteria bacterium]|nr:MAG: Mur ligase [Zetaproteobacteria bacterium]